MNLLEYLRVMGQSADILFGVRRDIFYAGDTVGPEMGIPIARLEG
jgi:hypothetical protein